MDSNSFFIRRVGVAKGAGLAFGLLGFFMVPLFWPDESVWLRVGVLLWYTTFGAMIGVMGVFNHHPLLKFRLPFWVRGPVFGAWLNLVLAFLMHDKLGILMQQLGGAFGGVNSPFWIVLEGAVVGLVVDFVATRAGGEGLPSSA